MSRKQYSKELKLELVKKHLEDGISYWKLGKEYIVLAEISGTERLFKATTK